jgi:hypothetical protein
MPPLARALPALLLWAAGCEILVSGQLGEVRCEIEGAVGPPACPAAYSCELGVCVPSLLGAPCSSDAQCDLGDFCLDPAVFGATGAPRCSRTCCTSSDCDVDGQQICWIPPDGGASLCWPAAAVGRTVTGTAAAWAACAADSDCRSGRCTGGNCADTCCSDTSCLAGDGVCRFGVAPAADTQSATGFWCAAAVSGTAARYAECKSDAECASGLCVELAPETYRCSAPCCSSEDCEGIEDATAGLMPVRCITLSGSGDARACAALGAGISLVGDVCVTGTDCRSGMCDGPAGQKRCSDVCCSDATCGNPGSLVCRPVEVGDAWALQCEPK